MLRTMLKGVKPVGSLSLLEFRERIKQMFGKAPSLARRLEGSKIAIALSGGADSMALCALAKDAFPRHNIVALFVNHGLESHGVTENEDLTRQALKKLGVEGKFLNVEWEANERETLTKGQLQETTRLKRYKLLLDACVLTGARVLLTGHSLEDDIVTMMYRLCHGSGIDGMAGMKSFGTFPIVHPEAANYFVGHPLLDVPKERLIKTCEGLDLTWNIDQSNFDVNYQRNSILDCLVSLQESKLVTREELHETMTLLKQIKGDIYRQVAPIFSGTVYINKSVGDATLLLKENDKLLKNEPVLTRVIGTLAQYVSGKSMPVKTKRMSDIRKTLLESIEEHRLEQKKKLSSMRHRQVKGNDVLDLQAFERARRVDMAQLTFGGATLYALARNDALRRANMIAKFTRSTVEYGPAFLVQREPSSRINNQKTGFKAQPAELAPGEAFLWDNRIYLKYVANDSKPRKFLISFLTVADVREFELMAPKIIRRNLYFYLGCTPGTHLYQVPVIREEGTSYMAFPTLNVQYPIDTYQWTFQHAGDSILVSKLLCLA